MVKIVDVEKNSIAEKAGLCAGDIINTINSSEIKDVLDYKFYLYEKKIKLNITRDGQTLEIEISKGQYDDIGLEFESALMDKKRQCHNKCIFCFIDQNPKGMRETIYFKDDDTRLSFLHGNYVTMTNLSDSDIDRIIKMKISPINVSVHTTNEELRCEMMKNKRSGKVLSYLKRLAENGISLCCQIVLCRGVNDGSELLNSMHDIAALHPAVTSCSIVPAGITKHREGLFPLTQFSDEECASVIDMIDNFAKSCREYYGNSIFYASDEFYLRCGRELPSDEFYEGYPQIENGVGMIRNFKTELEFALEDEIECEIEENNTRNITLATGAAAFDLITESAQLVSQKYKHINPTVIKINNDFFGEQITVAGLITGVDLYEQLKDKVLGEELIIPSVMLRHERDLFLCGMSLTELCEKLNVSVRVIDTDANSFVSGLLGL